MRLLFGLGDLGLICSASHLYQSSSHTRDLVHSILRMQRQKLDIGLIRRSMAITNEYSILDTDIERMLGYLSSAPSYSGFASQCLG